MSGHSKWSTIKRKKEKTDNARAKVFTKIGREIAVVVREGGPDPNSNSKLKDVIAKAKANNVPNDNIERIIKKAAGEQGGANYETIIYEGYGPKGIAVIVEALTDNRNRTAGDVRHYFDKFGGNMGQSGSVSFLFTKQGVILIESEDIDEEKLFENLKYFLNAIMPICDKYDINMAIHPDDPAWSVFGLPRIITNIKNMQRLCNMVDNSHNGITLCSGSYGTNPLNDVPATIRALKGRIHFAHVRNLQFNDGKNDFEEAAHLSSDGSFDMYEIVKALYESGFKGPIRPDHGRMIWGEKAMPGYGLYDRALGAAYICGLWEAIQKGNKGDRKQ